MRRTIRILGGLCLLLGLATTARAQSAQKISLQLSGLSATVFGDEFTGWGSGVGFEAQVRYNPSAFSIGGGFQWTTHGVDETEVDLSGFDVSLKLSGVFVEPRYIITVNSDKVAPYVSGRLSILRESGTISDATDEITFSATGTTINGGGGILVRLSERTNLDIGATYGFTKFGDATVTGDGINETFESASGSNVIFRVGVSIGVGN